MGTPLAELVLYLSSTGNPPEVIAEAVRLAELHAQALVTGDPVAAKRRAYDRDRKRKQATENSTGKQPQKERSPTPPKDKLSPKDPELDLNTSAQEERSGVPRARARPACRLPPDWMPTLNDLAFAQALLPHQCVQIEIDKFRDHWHSRDGPNAVKRDWNAAWRNWCRRAVEMIGANNGQHRQSGSGPGQGVTLALYAKQMATGAR